MKLIYLLLLSGFCLAQVQLSTALDCYHCAYVEGATAETNSPSCEADPGRDELKTFSLGGRGSSNHLDFLNEGMESAVRQRDASSGIPMIITGIFQEDLGPNMTSGSVPPGPIYTYCMTVTGKINNKNVVYRNAAYLTANVGSLFCKAGQPPGFQFLLQSSKTCLCPKDGCNGRESTGEGGSNAPGGAASSTPSMGLYSTFIIFTTSIFAHVFY